MASELEVLGEAAAQLAVRARGRNTEIAERSERLAERLGRGRFHVSVLGEFKRGKSTFLDALIGAAVLPTGAIPVTAVATEVCFGPPGVTVVGLDGSVAELGEGDRLENYVTEAGNPANKARVDRVEVRVSASLLRSGLVLVDTPGLGSVHLHNDEAADRAVFDGDGAIVVLSADSPLSERERALVASLSERRMPTFLILNKTDHLDPDDLDQVRRFVTDALTAEAGGPPRLWCLAARPALAARMAGQEPGPECGEFTQFEAELGRFVEHDLRGVRLATARRELSGLARELSAGIQVATASLAMDATILAERVDMFKAAADAQRAALADDRSLLQRDTAALARQLGSNLAEFARQAPQRRIAELDRIAATVPLRRLDDELRQTVEIAVRTDFESFRRDQARFAEQAWRQLAEHQRAGVEMRVNTVRSAAADLFAVALPAVQVPEVLAEQERFFYLFVTVGSSTEDLGRVGRRLLPSGWQRRLLRDRAHRQIALEFDKHAGRARADLSERLDSVRHRFELAMTAQLERTIQTILAAAAAADERRHQSEMERERRSADDAAAFQTATNTLVLCAETDDTDG